LREIDMDKDPSASDRVNVVSRLEPPDPIPEWTHLEWPLEWLPATAANERSLGGWPAERLRDPLVMGRPQPHRKERGALLLLCSLVPLGRIDTTQPTQARAAARKLSKREIDRLQPMTKKLFLELLEEFVLQPPVVVGSSWRRRPMHCIANGEVVERLRPWLSPKAPIPVTHISCNLSREPMPDITVRGGPLTFKLPQHLRDQLSNILEGVRMLLQADPPGIKPGSAHREFAPAIGGLPYSRGVLDSEELEAQVLHARKLLRPLDLH